ncbi:hypothetical protein C479_13228 [Halovivax asiaticus JCM 14624]|uniref:Zinc-ribbon domain-containing protein n=1 Tax=Halovivax asiaticus JCM 14624 TaxID=1227490 RepID=M0BDC3_9EURY|nr:hypothetical protein [Halovivax asiaticus]ELZ08303.1 hypothetical protein C479_13228 [Halovivax asiaticus JCM 14624]
MNDPAENAADSDQVPETVRDQLDELELPELRGVLSYVQRRIESLRRPIAEEIVETATGEVVDIENHGTHAIVRTHPPDPDGPGVDTELVSLYHVRRERHVNGEELLHWSFLGDIRDTVEWRCNSCGRPLDASGGSCPHCGSEQTEPRDTER